MTQIKNVQTKKTSYGMYIVTWEYKEPRMRKWRTESEEVGGRSVGGFVSALKRSKGYIKE